jgi:hypothetical protein
MIKRILSFGIRPSSQAMVQETRTGVPIRVLSDNVQEIQQEVDDQANAIEAIGSRFERMETSKASFQSLLEERLPPRQLEPVQTPPQAMQGGQTPTNQLRQPVLEVQSSHGSPVGAETRNAMPMRPLTQEI